jgi:polysaccharide biosynthesis transport protein
MNFDQFIRALAARRKLFWTVFGSVLGLGILITLVWPTTYLGEASVVVDWKDSDTVTGQVLPMQLPAVLVATQVDIIRSHNVAAKVVDKLNLVKDPEWRAKYEAHGEGAIRDWIAEMLLKHLDVKPSREGNTINIYYPASDRDAAAAYTNAFADAYVRTNLELKADPARRQSAWFDEQLQVLRHAFEAAQRRLSEYQRAQDIVGKDERLDIENAKLTDINTALVTAQGAVYDAQTRLRQASAALARNKLEEVPDILGNPLLQTIKVDLTRAQGNFAQVAQHFDRNHPQYASAAAQVAELQSKLRSEIDSAMGSFSQSAQLAERRANELQRALDQQKERILGLKRRHDELDVLNHEVERTQRAYDDASQRASALRLEGQLNQSNIAILETAFPPVKQARPKLILWPLIAFVLAVISGLAAVLRKELKDRRVRASIDLTAAGIELLVELPRMAELPVRRRLLQRKVAQPAALTQSA